VIDLRKTQRVHPETLPFVTSDAARILTASYYSAEYVEYTVRALFNLFLLCRRSSGGGVGSRSHRSAARRSTVQRARLSKPLLPLGFFASPCFPLDTRAKT